MTTKEQFIEQAEGHLAAVETLDAQIAAIPEKGGYVGSWRVSQITGDWEEVPVYRSQEEQAEQFIRVQNNLLARAQVYATLALSASVSITPIIEAP